MHDGKSSTAIVLSVCCNQKQICVRKTRRLRIHHMSYENNNLIRKCYVYNRKQEITYSSGSCIAEFWTGDLVALHASSSFCTINDIVSHFYNRIILPYFSSTPLGLQIFIFVIHSRSFYALVRISELIFIIYCLEWPPPLPTCSYDRFIIFY